MSHPAESLHWYDKNGAPAYEVPRAKGDGMRPTTLRDARVHGYVPSVTSIIRCAAAPGLEAWKQQQVLLAALTLPRNSDEPEKEWLDRVMQDSREQGRKAAEKGTAIHAAIQGHYEGKAPDPDYFEYVKSAVTEVDTYFTGRKWVAEASFSHPLGFGGKTDLFTQGIVIDFKTKEFYDDTKKLAWDEHAIQLAAYREGLGMPDAICANVFVSTVKPSLAVCHVWEEEDIQNGWKMFESLLSYWQAKNKYSWGTPAENEADKRRHGTVAQGSRHGIAKLNEEAVRILRIAIPQGFWNPFDAAKVFGVNPSVIRAAVAGKNWRHVA